MEGSPWITQSKANHYEIIPMRIAVCLKQVSFLYARTGNRPDENFVAAHDIVRLNNPLDEVALERAVQLSDAVGGEVWILSAGGEFFEKEARRALAIGADTFVRLHDPEWGLMDARTTALVLSKAVRKLSADIVLCGARSLDLAQGQVGCYLASNLDYPYLSSVVRMNVSQHSKTMIVRRSLGRGRFQELECTLPAVVAVERTLCEPRYPSYREVLKAADKEIITWNGNELGLEGSEVVPFLRLGRVTEPKPRPKWIPIPDSELPAVERIRLLLSRDDAQKKGTLLEEGPEDLARSMIQFLKDEGLL
ncbi:MAG TPA: hypothetical protein VK463_03485 [Desulfomonilaceae bacterium]|nr:hypothetical protein [Desulfomonilaceae bacterium]